MYIYKITNTINNKVYIGQTVNLSERFRSHRESAFRKHGRDYNKPLYKAFRKYGIENFTFEVIDSAENIDELNEKEIYWIDFYDCLIDSGKGYNLEKGGNNGLKSETTKNKMSHSQRGEKNPSFGKKGGESFRAIGVINITTGKKYPSMIDCAIEEYGDKKYLKQISRVCDVNSNRQSYKGNVYRALDKNGDIVEKSMKTVNEAFKPVKVIDTISGRIFNTISEASSELSISDNMVRDRIYKRIKNDKYKDKFNLEIYN